MKRTSTHQLRRACANSALVVAALLTPRLGQGQVVAPSIFTTGIHVQGEAAGTEYDDWTTANIPVAVADPEDNPGDLDIRNVQIANDNDYIYIRATTFATSTISLVNIFLAFDTDQNKTTGFDILQVGELGSELGYQNDYPFAQHQAAFNLNISLTGGPVNNGGALIFPYWADATGPHGTQMEWAVPRAVTVQYPPALGGPKPSFPNPSFNFVIYTPDGLGDITDVISYTIATAPATQTGDFDGDGDVDGNDLLLWQRGLGTATGATVGQGDANGDHAVNAADLAIWKSKFGTPAVAAAGAVPEPTSAAIMAIVGIALVAGKRRLPR